MLFDLVIEEYMYCMYISCVVKVHCSEVNVWLWD